jgi:hypothetical protein
VAADLNHHHRVTLEKIFSHPLSGNVEWRQVLSLLEAVGTTTQEPNGKVKVELGGETPRSSSRQATRTSTGR